LETIADETFIVGVVESLYNAVAPRFSNRDEDRMNTVAQAKPDNYPHGPGISVAAPEVQGVVQLQVIRDAHGFPTAQKPLADVGILFRSLSLGIDFMAEQVNDIQRIESTVIFDVAWPHKIHLVDVVASQGLGEVRVFDPFGHIGSFF